MHELRRKPHVVLDDSSSRCTQYSVESAESQSTAPTSLYHESPRPSLHQPAACPPIDALRSSYEMEDEENSRNTTFRARSSTETYASTLNSNEDLCDEPEEINDYEVSPNYDVAVEVDTRPSNTQEFARLFPSTRRLVICHDNTTSDRNMNLRVETPVTELVGRHGEVRKAYMQLFHLRMHDLKKREFSLRRYCRESGREVCHSVRRYKTTSDDHKITSLPASVTHALSNMVPRPEPRRQNSSASTASKSPRSQKAGRDVFNLRKDSGYASSREEHDHFYDELDADVDDEDFESFLDKAKPKNLQLPTNTTNLEFSNYAQIQLKRRGAKNSKRYEYEYWGTKYHWKRVVDKTNPAKPISFHLVRSGEPAHSEPIAHIVPEPLSKFELQSEFESGGWVPQCSLWISDSSVMQAEADIAEAIVATGLIALVDDCIKTRWRRLEKPSHHLRLPGTRVEVEYVGPKALVQHVFKRRTSTSSNGSNSRDDRHRHSPLRHENPVAAS